MIRLPQPQLFSTTSVEQALHRRRSVREFMHDSLSIADLGQLLWAAQGVTNPTDGGRTTPSAGALYPLETYCVVGRVDGVSPGIYGYDPLAHALRARKDGDKRSDLYRAALQQPCVRDAPLVIIFTAAPQRMKWKYGGRTERYIAMEAGHAAQNVSLQAVPLGLGTVVVGAFQDADVKTVLGLPTGEDPLYLIPVGRIQH